MQSIEHIRQVLVFTDRDSEVPLLKDEDYKFVSTDIALKFLLSLMVNFGGQVKGMTGLLAMPPKC